MGRRKKKVATPAARQDSPSRGFSLAEWLRRPAVWPYLFLAVLAFGVYANVLGNGFLTDDNLEAFQDPAVMNLRRLPSLLLSDFLRMSHPETPSNFYRPLPLAIQIFLYAVAGNLGAWPWHLNLVLMHVANTLLLFRLSRRLLPTTASAVVAAALFAVHPIHTENVAWVAAFSETPFTLFALWMLDRFVGQGGAPSGRQIAGHSGLYFLALCSKETAIVLPAILAGVEWILLGRSIREIWKNRWLYVSLALAAVLYLGIRIHALGGIVPAQGASHHLGRSELALTAAVLLARYLGLLILPLGLSYMHPFVAFHSLTLLVLLAIAVDAAAVAAIPILRRRWPLASFGMLLILIPLMPAMNINGIAKSALAERYLYLPSVGFVWIAALGWEWLAQRQRRAAMAAGAAIVLLWSVQTIARNRDWRDDLTLMTVTARQHPDDGVALAGLAETHQGLGQYDLAMEEFRRALALQPNQPSAHLNLGALLMVSGKRDEALPEFRKALALSPDYADAHLDLGSVLDDLGDPAAGIAEVREALRLRPDFPEALNVLGVMHKKRKEYAEAITVLQRAVARKPNYSDAYFNLGATLNDAGRYQEAAAAFGRAIATGPQSHYLYLMHYGLGLAYDNLNQPKEAAAEFEETLRLRPDYSKARASLDEVRKLMDTAAPKR